MSPRLARVCFVTMVAATAACRAAAPPDAPAPATAQVAGVVLTDDQIRNGGIRLAAVETVSRAPQLTVPAAVALDETRTARIGSLQEGLILQTLAQVGDRVRAGQLLATMHGHAMHDAWAGYRKARADERRLENELAFATDAHQRLQRLHDQKAVALQDVRRADVERIGAVERLTAAKAEIVRSIEELEHVGIDVDPSAPEAAEARADEPIPVRTPMAGTVLDRLITPGTTVIVGAPLYVVSDLSVVWVLARLDEAMVADVRVAQSATVRVAAYPDERFTGTVTFVADRLEPDTRRLVVRATVANTGQRLKPDMLATVSFTGSASRPAVVVPRRAVQTIDGQATVFVAESANRFVPRAITLAGDGEDPVEVSSGVRDGERIVVDGSFLLKSELLKPAQSGS